MINAITRSLFTTEPRETLYHYTSLSGMQGIIGSRELRASDIRYMNDSAELRHTLELLNRQVTRRILSGVDHPEHLNAFLDWLGGRIVSGPMLFGASFRANGNLLSQWRGYSVHGKGVSLGFDPAEIAHRAALQGFSVGRCIYDPDEQQQLIEEVIDGVESMGRESRDALPLEQRFEPIEEDLLRIAAVLKHPAFEEEQEWRIVSPMIDDVHLGSIHFREGASMLVPYFAFELADPGGSVSLDHVYIGPSSNAELSMHSLRLYLEQQGAAPRYGVRYCNIPFRRR
ncbi:MAG: DUF2971 domain-containing protein [Halieaceae bacterium]|jgi:hypothetical protein|nr:DUF2971 domain-containing protein [Halieaceae bacterium]